MGGVFTLLVGGVVDAICPRGGVRPARAFTRSPRSLIGARRRRRLLQVVSKYFVWPASTRIFALHKRQKESSPTTVQTSASLTHFRKEGVGWGGGGLGVGDGPDGGGGRGLPTVSGASIRQRPSHIEEPLSSDWNHFCSAAPVEGRQTEARISSGVLCFPNCIC